MVIDLAVIPRGTEDGRLHRAGRHIIGHVETKSVVTKTAGQAQLGGGRNFRVKIGRGALERHVVVVDARSHRIGAVDRVGAGTRAGDEEVVLLARSWAIVDIRPTD